MDEARTRREFLKKLMAIFATGALKEALGTGSAAARDSQHSGARYKISQWTGDNFMPGHNFRDGKLPGVFPAQPEKKVDFVIVGGGIAGLSSAWYLRNHDLLLLDQYETLGGQSRGGSYRGIDYSYGPAYVDTVDGIYGRLYGELGIAPQKLAEGDNAFLWDKHWLAGLKPGQSNGLYLHFKRLLAESASSIKLLPNEPTPENTQSGDLLKMDALRFVDVLKGYPPEFIALLQSICKSAACANVEQVSALTGYYLLEDLGSSNYVFEGGNPAIARALIGKLGGKTAPQLQSGAFVWKIRLSEGGANVFYSSADGQLHNVFCKHVIVATPPMVAWRQMSNLDDKMKAALMPFRYGSYLVANCLLDKPLFQGSYDNFVGAPFSFSDLIVAETPYKLAGQYKQDMGSVLTVYHPWEPGSAGRTLLLAGDRQAFAASIHDQLSQLLAHLDKHLQEIVLTRWGHALVVTGPNFFVHLRKIQSQLSGPYSLAYSGVQGLPCVESAIRGARLAADRALSAAAKTSWVVPSNLV